MCGGKSDPLPAKKSNQKIDVYRSVMIDRVYAPCVKTDRPAGRNVPTQYVSLSGINEKNLLKPRDWKGIRHKLRESVSYVLSRMRPCQWAEACCGFTYGPRWALCSQEDMNNSCRPSSSSPSAMHLLLFPLPSTASRRPPPTPPLMHNCTWRLSGKHFCLPPPSIPSLPRNWHRLELA